MAMPVADLLRWDVSLISRSLLTASSYAAMETEMLLKNGQSAHYGLGVSLAVRDGHRLVSHGGEVGGFVAWNGVFPDDKVAVAVLTNQEASAAAGNIGRAISSLLLPPPAPAGPVAGTAEASAKEILAGLQQGRIDRSRLTANCNFYFSQPALDDYRQSLAGLGEIKTVRQTSTSLRGGMTFRAFDVEFASGTKVTLSTFTTPDGKLEQFLVDAG
jgi:CubicO group peptidase (beta-lactamase class C family)